MHHWNVAKELVLFQLKIIVCWTDRPLTLTWQIAGMWAAYGKETIENVMCMSLLYCDVLKYLIFRRSHIIRVAPLHQKNLPAQKVEGPRAFAFIKLDSLWFMSQKWVGWLFRGLDTGVCNPASVQLAFHQALSYMHRCRKGKIFFFSAVWGITVFHLLGFTIFNCSTSQLLLIISSLTP